MTEFILGLATATATASWSIIIILMWLKERKARVRLERKVDQLWKHLSCGEGYLGCDGGPECPWDHK